MVQVHDGAPYGKVTGKVPDVAHNHEDEGSSPSLATNERLTQLGECLTCKREVIVSSPIVFTNVSLV